MTISVKGRTIGKVAVIGSGNIGPDIALHFAQSLAAQGVKIVVVDVVQKALDGGTTRICAHMCTVGGTPDCSAAPAGATCTAIGGGCPADVGVCVPPSP